MPSFGGVERFVPRILSTDKMKTYKFLEINKGRGSHYEPRPLAYSSLCLSSIVSETTSHNHSYLVDQFR
jgi:hypothetical protein